MKIKLSPALPIFLLSLATTQNATFVLAPVLAAFIHECGHLIATRALRITIKSMRLSIFGASIETDMLCCSYRKEILFALCGPLANLISAAAVYFCFGTSCYGSRLFIASSLFFAVLNLLPAGSFDGGRIFSSTLHLFLPIRTVTRITEAISFLIFFSLWCASVYLIMRSGAYLSLFIFSMSLFARLFLSDEAFSQF